MNVNSEIRKKSYVSPVISFDEIEEEQALLAGSRTDGGGSEVDPGNGENTGNDPDFGGSNGARVLQARLAEAMSMISCSSTTSNTMSSAPEHVMLCDLLTPKGR